MDNCWTMARMPLSRLQLNARHRDGLMHARWRGMFDVFEQRAVVAIKFKRWRLLQNAPNRLVGTAKTADRNQCNSALKEPGRRPKVRSLHLQRI
jgi:hypothetical protein